MIALSICFLAGRYHATPWGRHVNEAAIAWPPEPYRMLRALIACYHRKADRDSFSEETLSGLIDGLAETLPVYRLPEAVHAHTRHYMPLGKKRKDGEDETTLVFDAFARLDPEEPLHVGWPHIALSDDQHALLSHLAERLGYLGRAESWVEARLDDWSGDGANAMPLQDENEASPATPEDDRRAIPLYVPLAPHCYLVTRDRLITEERERRRAAWAKKTKPTDSALDKDMKGFHGTLPERLIDALSVDTSDLQAAGWSDPPAARRVIYLAQEPAPIWRGARRSHADGGASERPTLARFVLAGRPPPRVEDTVKIAEIMRRAALSKFGWEDVNGRKRPLAPPVISGYDADGSPEQGDRHGHAFWLPEDANNDSKIDHLLIYAADGFDAECRRRLDRITRLWLDKCKSGKDEKEEGSSGRKEWRLALEGFGKPNDFASESRLLGTEPTKWVSVTPYLAPWHSKRNFQWQDQISCELAKRCLPKLSEPPMEVEEIEVGGRKRRPIHFHRFRSRRGLTQPDTLGRFLILTFEEPFTGPLALGYGCHFGLGLFEPYPDRA